MCAIYRKELSQMFHSMIGYIYLASFLLIGGIYFVTYQLIPANRDISKFFSQLMSTVIFLLPMLTMRSYAEERRLKTESLLMSAPVSASAIALGKFFAVLTVFIIGLSFTILYVICLAVLGQFEPLVVLGNYAGMIAAASSFLAIADGKSDYCLYYHLLDIADFVADWYGRKLCCESGFEITGISFVYGKQICRVFNGDF